MPTRTAVLMALLWSGTAVVVGLVARAVAGPSTALHRRVAATGVMWPAWLADGLVLVLVGCFLLAVWLAVRRRWASLPVGAAAAVGVVLAYAASRLVKVLVTEDRPCLSVVPRSGCPAAGDWSIPSNHATIAFGLATAIVVLVRRWWSGLAYLVGMLAAVARVIEGVHYPHDVLAGAALGVGMTMVCRSLLAPPARAVLARLTRAPALVRTLGDWTH